MPGPPQDEEPEAVAPVTLFPVAVIFEKLRLVEYCREIAPPNPPAGGEQPLPDVLPPLASLLVKVNLIGCHRC